MTDSSEKRGGRQRRLILHTADLHLDTLDDDGCACLRAVVELALDRGVDLVIIAGDLFDHNRAHDGLVSFVAGQLGRLQVPVVILPGNHDCLTPGAVLGRPEFSHSAKIRVITDPHGETVELPRLGISLWGKSIDSHDGNLRPLEGMAPPQQNGRWHIALAHGYYVGSGPAMFPSLHISREEMAAGWDYLALGHIPVFRCVCSEPLAYYCGAPAFTGAVALVELGLTGVKVSRCPL